MAINNVNIKAALSADNLQKLDEQQFKDMVSVFDEQVKNDVHNKVDTSDGINNSEKEVLENWAKFIDKALGNIPSKLVASCKDAINKLVTLHASLLVTSENTGHIDGENTTYENGSTTLNSNFIRKHQAVIDEAEDAEEAEEAEETDSVPYNQRPKAQGGDLKQLSNADLVAESEIIKSQFHLEGDMKRDYDSCFTNVWGKGVKIKADDYRMIEGNLKKFQEKYKEKLQNKSSSFNKLDNYAKIEIQISYYTELAERAKQENQQQYLDTLSSGPKQPSKEETQAYWREQQKASKEQHAFEQKNYNEWLNGS